VEIDDMEAFEVARQDGLYAPPQNT